MTKELITNVLDIQIQQLEENGLKSCPSSRISSRCGPTSISSLTPRWSRLWTC